MPVNAFRACQAQSLAGIPRARHPNDSVVPPTAPLGSNTLRNRHEVDKPRNASRPNRVQSFSDCESDLSVTVLHPSCDGIVHRLLRCPVCVDRPQKERSRVSIVLGDIELAALSHVRIDPDKAAAPSERPSRRRRRWDTRIPIQPPEAFPPQD